MSELPFLPLWVSKYEARTAHLSLEEDGAYTRLLRLSWMTPKCQLPADDGWIMRRMRVDQATYERVVKPILVEFFYQKEGAWRNARLLAEYTARTQSKKQKSDAGSRGGQNSARKRREKGSESASSPLGADGQQSASMPESRIHIHKACKQALEKRVQEALGNGVAHISAEDVADAVEVWLGLGATDDEIVNTVRRQTLHRRKRPLTALRFLTPDIERVVAARLSAPSPKKLVESRPLERPVHPRAAACFEAIEAAYKLPAMEAWLGGAQWTEDEVQLPTEFARAQVEQRFGSVLRHHGFSAGLSAS